MISVYKYPLYIAPVYRPIIFDVKSDVSTTLHPELQIKGTLYVRIGNTYKPVAIKYQTQYAGQQYYRFNFSSQLKSYLAFDMAGGTANELITPSRNTVVLYYVRFQEIYNNANGLMAGFWDGMTTVHYATNATLQHMQCQTLNTWTIKTVINAPYQNFVEYTIQIGEPQIGIITVPPIGPIILQQNNQFQQH